MRRVLVLSIAALLVPGAILATLAVRLAGRERAAALRGLDERIAAEADRLAREAGSAVARSRERAEALLAAPAPGEAPPWVCYLTLTGDIRYDRPARGPTAEDAEELRLYDRSVEGGESFEFERRDPSRALDAYAFYLPRIRSPVLRARLGYRIARAAGADGQVALAERMREALVRTAGAATTEEGLPIAALAAAMDGPAGADPELRALFRVRRELERATRARRGPLERQGAALFGDLLLVARPIAADLRAVAAARVVWPSFDVAARYDARLDEVEAATDSLPAGTAARPIPGGADGAPVGSVVVHDRGYAGDRDRIQRLYLLGCALALFAACAALAGAGALVRSTVKERRLARLRARLIANVSHELKSPVTSLRLFADMLAQDPLDDERTRRFGKLMRAESQRLGQLIENLLDCSRPGRAKVELELEPVDIAAVLHRVAEGFGYRAREKGARFDVDVPPGGTSGMGTVAHAGAVERITLNLLDNALKYRRSNDPWIRLSARGDGQVITIAVADNGPGIPPAERERIFEEFYRLRYDDYAVRGSGLGLTIARGLARRMGGDIDLESRAGEGCTFSLKLPVRQLPGEDT